MKCFVVNCGISIKTKGVNNLSFHRFPANDKTRKMWKRQLGLYLSYPISSKDKVCSQHFRPEDIVKKMRDNRELNYLRPGAVPFQPQGVKKQKAFCCLCLSNAKPVNSIVDKTYKNISYLNIYFEVVGIPLNDYPSFPMKICADCDGKLIRVYKFLEKCLETEEHKKKLQDEGNQDINNDTIRPICLEEENETLTSEITIEEEIKEETIEEPPKIPDEELNVASGKPRNEGMKNFPARLASSEFIRPTYIESDEEMNETTPLEITIKEEIEEEVIEGSSKMPEEVMDVSSGDPQIEALRTDPLFLGDEEMNIKKEIKEEVIDEPTKIADIESSVANESCASSSKMKINKKTRNEIMGIKCKKCSKIFLRMKEFRSHDCVTNHKQESEEVSEEPTALPEIDETEPSVVNKVCDDLSEKETNMESNYELMLLKCEKCTKIFKGMEVFRKHACVTNSHPKNKAQCKICWKEFNSKQYLNVHLLTHERKLYICPLCPDGPDSIKYSDIRSVQLHFNKIHLALKELYDLEKYVVKKT